MALSKKTINLLVAEERRLEKKLRALHRDERIYEALKALLDVYRPKRR